MDPDSDSSQDVTGDAVDLLHRGNHHEQNAKCPDQDSNMNEQNTSDNENNDEKDVVRGDDLLDDGFSSDEEVSQAVDQQRLVDGAEGQGHHLCEQSVPSTSSPVRPVGGSVSTNTAQCTRNASGDQVLELVEAVVRRGEQASYDLAVEARRDSDSTHNEVHVHLTQTNIHKPAAVTLGGQVVVQPPKEKMKTSECPPPPTEVQKLRDETERSFEKWTEGMVTTRATQAVLHQISRGRTWVTITGSPGEGKTTAGYLVLKHLHSMGRQVYDIKIPEDYFKVKHAKQPVLMLNDIFGSLHFDMNDVKKWGKVLTDVLGMREHKKDEDIDARDRKKPQFTVILISRSSILKEASHHLGRFKDLVFKEDCVVDFTHGLTIAVEERLKIWKSATKGCNIDISDKVIKEVCYMSTSHGFPHCCRLFVEMYFNNKHLDIKSFFSKPLEFLNQTMESLMMNAVTGPLLREMLRQDGTLDLDSVTDDERRYQYTSAVETLTGTYLSHDRGIVTFHHPSVYDSAAVVVCKKDPLFVIKHCSLSFLNERVIFSGLESGSEENKLYKVEVSDKYVPPFLNRLKFELEADNLSLTLSQQSFHDSGFVAQFMKCILPPSDVQPLSDSVRQIIHRKDKCYKATFLYLMTKSKSDRILRYVCQFVKLSQEDQAEVVFGICEHSSVSALEYFLNNNGDFNLNLRHFNQQTPLLSASKTSSGRILKLLLERDVDVNITDAIDFSVLQYICKHGVDGDVDVLDIVKMLIEKGASVNGECQEYKFSISPCLPLHIACYEAHTNVVKALLLCGADVNLEDSNGYTPIIYASMSPMSRMDVVTILLDRGADVNKAISCGETSLYAACRFANVDVVTVLSDRGADINKTYRHGDTALLAACSMGRMDCVTVLLDRGADINKTDSSGDTPLHKVCCNGNVDVVTVLLDIGADINKTNSFDETALHKACTYGNVDIVTVLLDRGASINKKNNLDETPLHRACCMGKVDVVTTLSHRGADINTINICGKTSLFTACTHGNVDVVTDLLDRGADINKTDKFDDTPLHTACTNENADVVTVLLDRGADINKTNSLGNTPLHTACYNVRVKVVPVLLDRGADINKTNNGGDTPILTPNVAGCGCCDSSHEQRCRYKQDKYNEG